MSFLVIGAIAVIAILVVIRMYPVLVEITERGDLVGASVVIAIIAVLTLVALSLLSKAIK